MTTKGISSGSQTWVRPSDSNGERRAVDQAQGSTEFRASYGRAYAVYDLSQARAKDWISAAWIRLSVPLKDEAQWRRMDAALGTLLKSERAIPVPPSAERSGLRKAGAWLMDKLHELSGVPDLTPVTYHSGPGADDPVMTLHFYEEGRFTRVFVDGGKAVDLDLSDVPLKDSRGPHAEKLLGILEAAASTVRSAAAPQDRARDGFEVAQDPRRT